MKLQKAAHLSGFARVIRHVVGRQPELAQPDVQEQIGQKTSEIKNVLFDGNALAERERLDAQGCARVLIVEEPLGEDEVEHAAQRDQNGQGPPEGALRDVQSLARQEPYFDENNRR